MGRRGLASVIPTVRRIPGCVYDDEMLWRAECELSKWAKWRCLHSTNRISSTRHDRFVSTASRRDNVYGPVRDTENDGRSEQDGLDERMDIHFLGAHLGCSKRRRMTTKAWHRGMEVTLDACSRTWWLEDKKVRRLLKEQRSCNASHQSKNCSNP